MTSKPHIADPHMCVDSTTGSGRPKQWAIAFWIAYAVLDDAAQKQLRRALIDSEPLVAYNGKHLLVVLSATGTMPQATMSAMEQLWTGFEAIGIDDFQVVRCLASTNGEEGYEVTGEEPLMLYGVSEFAQLLDVTRQRISQLRTSDDFPKPDAYVGKRPLWKPGRVHKYMEKRRREKLSKTIGHIVHESPSSVTELID